MDQCQLRWQEIGAKRIGEHWTNAEDRALTDVVTNNQELSWPQITDALLQRTGSLRLVRQCRDRWSLVLEPIMKTREAQRRTPETESTDSALGESDSEEDDDDISPAHIQLNSPRWEDL